jgi:cell division protein DivIC
LFIKEGLNFFSSFFLSLINSIFVEQLVTMDKKEVKGKVSKMLSYKYLIAIILFLAWILFFDENSIVIHQQNKKRLHELTQQKVYYKERIESDKQKLEDLRSGVEELEKFAREQYYMSKPDEDVFIVVEEEK